MKGLKAIRAGERVNTAVGFSTLFGLIGSHSILETARDALFLSSIPASRLPWVYLAIAAASLLITQTQGRLGGRLRGRAALSANTLGAAAVTFAFWALLDRMGEAGLYALYIWSGVLTALVVVQFWTLLADTFTVTQAKRLYGLVGAGSVAGAIAGTALASALARVAGADTLLLASAVGLFVTGSVPLAFRGVGDAHGDAAAPGHVGLLESGSYVLANPYTRRVALLVIVGAATVTLVDYIFKSAVSAAVAPGELAEVFATVYLTLNVASLVVQLGAVGWILRRFGVITALSLLPLLLFVGGAGLLLSGSVVAALLLKGADGALRYSLARTSTELLFVPLSERARRRAKAFIDVLGQRGGQALASVGILAGLGLGMGADSRALILLALALAWLAVVWGLRTSYLEVFRRHLRRDQIRHIDRFPELDLASLETVLAALDAPEDSEVIAALDILEAEHKAHLVPALILHHPSEEVVERALSLFASAGRKRVVPVLDRQLDHPSPRIRAAALAARSVLAPDEDLLRRRLSCEESPEVRATIMVNLIAGGAIVGSDAADALKSICRHGSPAARQSLAEAIGRRRATGLDDVLLELARACEVEVRLAAARAMGEVHSTRFLPALIELLGHERTRREARAVLRSYGADGLAALETALHSRDLDPVLRWQVPRAIASFEPADAARILLARLPIEWEGMVRYRILRSLEALVRRNPKLPLDTGILESVIADTVSRAYRYLDRRQVLVRGAEADPRRATDGHRVLVDMLRDKEVHAVDRLFRLLDLAHPRENYLAIYRGLSSRDPETRASSMELIDNLLEPPLRDAVRGLVDDLEDGERLAEGTDFHRPDGVGYAETLAAMLESSSESVQDLTCYHIAEMGMLELRGHVARMPRDARARPDVARCLEILDALAAERMSGARHAE